MCLSVALLRILNIVGKSILLLQQRLTDHIFLRHNLPFFCLILPAETIDVPVTAQVAEYDAGVAEYHVLVSSRFVGAIFPEADILLKHEEVGRTFLCPFHPELAVPWNSRSVVRVLLHQIPSVFVSYIVANFADRSLFFEHSSTCSKFCFLLIQL